MSLIATASAIAAFEILLIGLAIYLAIGLVTAIALLACGNRGLGAFDPHALRNDEAKSSIGFRALIFPGLVALWPFVLWRRWRGSEAIPHGRPHIDRRHRVSWIVLLIALPPLFVAAMLSGRMAGPPLVDALTTGSETSPTGVSTTGDTGIPLARIQVDAELPADGFVDRLQFSGLVLRSDAQPGGDWLHTDTSADAVLPPDTLLYWQPDAGDQASFAVDQAYLLGPLPAGQGRLALPAAFAASLAQDQAGVLAGYSLARQELLFVEPLLASSSGGER